MFWWDMFYHIASRSYWSRSHYSLQNWLKKHQLITACEIYLVISWKDIQGDLWWTHLTGDRLCLYFNLSHELFAALLSDGSIAIQTFLEYFDDELKDLRILFNLILISFKMPPKGSKKKKKTPAPAPSDLNVSLHTPVCSAAPSPAPSHSVMSPFFIERTPDWT